MSKLCSIVIKFRSNTFDAVISIGVIHHFTTVERRVEAISELARVLRPEGKLMIYVWALEQSRRKVLYFFFFFYSNFKLFLI